MYSTFDKTLITAIMSVVQLANMLGMHFGLSEATVTSVVVMLTPFLVYVVPNLPKN